MQGGSRRISMAQNEPVERITAWRCIGCGRIEGAQPCIGICQDRKAEFVYSSDYDRLAALVRKLARTTPREGEWERSYRALQETARQALRKLGEEISAD